MRHEDARTRLPELIGLRPAGDDDQELISHVAGCARCRARLDRLRAIDSGLRALDAPPRPSPGLERRVLAIPMAAGTPERRRRTRRPAIAAATVLLLVGGALGLLVAQGDPERSPGFQAERVVRLDAPRSETVSAHVEIGAVEGGRRRVRVVATGLPHGGDRYYGLWLTGADGAVSGGSFRPDGEGGCVVMLQVPAGDWTALDITASDQPPSRRTTVANAPI